MATTATAISPRMMMKKPPTPSMMKMTMTMTMTKTGLALMSKSTWIVEEWRTSGRWLR